jgi:hypothetical protein
MLGAGGPLKLPLPEQNYLPVSSRITHLSEPSELIQILALVPGLQEGDSLHLEIVLSGLFESTHCLWSDDIRPVLFCLMFSFA